MRYAAVVLAFIAAGCLTPREVVPVTYYRLAPALSVPEAPPSGLSLGMRPLDVARIYKNEVVYRTGENAVGVLESAKWAEPPTATVHRALSDALIATGRFADVGDAADMAAPELILTGELRRFDQVRGENGWMAECAARIEVRQARTGGLYWSGTVSAKEPLARNETSALPEAMEKAVSELVNSAAGQIAAASQE